jgi:prepilin peptidase CpaA
VVNLGEAVAELGFWIFVAVSAAYVTLAAFTDLTLHRVPNYLTVPAAIVGLAVAGISQWLPAVLPGYPVDLTRCVLGFGVGFGLFFIPFALGGGGAGDVKLCAALGALLGLWMLLAALIGALIFAAIAAIVVSIAGLSRADKPGGKSRRRKAFPFAVPVALGTWCLLGGLIWFRYHPEQLVPSPSPASHSIDSGR